MTHNKFDEEYYVMNVDGANNHPLLSWGNTDFTPFLQGEPIEGGLELPLKIIFGEPYPNQYEMADLLMLDANFAVSSKMKELLEEMGVEGIQFFPVEIESNKKEKISGHYAIHICNRLGLDMDNYEGGQPNRFGTIRMLNKFSLDEEQVNQMALNKRLLAVLTEKKIVILVHQNLYEAIIAESLTGIVFTRVDKWTSAF